MKRAILIAGGIDDSLWRPRYRNDLVAYFRFLVSRGFTKQDIRVLLRDGPATDLDGDGQPEATLAATRANLVRELAQLSQLEAEDLFVLVASNHGDPNGICLWEELPD